MPDPAEDDDFYLCLENGCYCDDPQMPDQVRQLCVCPCHGDDDA